jgi:hypothetical protein
MSPRKKPSKYAAWLTTTAGGWSSPSKGEWNRAAA